MDKGQIEELKLVFITREECQDVQDKFNEKLSKEDIAFSEIRVKLNLVIGILSAVGTAVLGVVIKLIF